MMKKWLPLCVVLLITACGSAEPEAPATVVAKQDGPVVPNSYLIYFDWDKAVLNEAGQKKLSDVTSDLKRKDTPYALVLNGHADASGSEPYNMKLSERRAHKVKALLTGLGIPDKAISVFAFGETDLAVPTKDGVREPLNRRVEIFVE
jgi:OmpA-OmpF porin, OOP family